MPQLLAAIPIALQVAGASTAIIMAAQMAVVVAQPAYGVGRAISKPTNEEMSNEHN